MNKPNLSITKIDLSFGLLFVLVLACIFYTVLQPISRPLSHDYWVHPGNKFSAEEFGAHISVRNVPTTISANQFSELTLTLQEAKFPSSTFSHDPQQQVCIDAVSTGYDRSQSWFLSDFCSSPTKPDGELSPNPSPIDSSQTDSRKNNVNIRLSDITTSTWYPFDGIRMNLSMSLDWHRRVEEGDFRHSTAPQIRASIDAHDWDELVTITKELSDNRAIRVTLVPDKDISTPASHATVSSVDDPQPTVNTDNTGLPRTNVQIQFHRPYTTMILFVVLFVVIWAFAFAIMFLEQLGEVLQVVIGIIFGLWTIKTVLTPTYIVWFTMVDALIYTSYFIFAFALLVRFIVRPLLINLMYSCF